MRGMTRAAGRMVALFTGASLLTTSTFVGAQSAPPATHTLPPLPTSAPPPPAPPSSAPAPEAATQDLVVLKDGSLLRGGLVEVLPNDHVTMQLATGETAIVQWSRIERIERGGTGAAPVPPPYTPWGQSPLRPGGVSVLIHIASDSAVNLEQRGGAGYAWKTVCTAPCDRPLPTNYEYRITGDGIRTSRAFALEGQVGERLVLSVSARSSATRTGGLVMTIAGAAALFASLVVFVDAASKQRTEDDAAALADRPARDVSSSEDTAGLVLLVAGAAVTAVGVVLFARSSSSKVAQLVAGTALRGPAIVPTRAAGLLGWHETTGPRPAIPTMFPIWSASF
jgi:hypothetical protein